MSITRRTFLETAGATLAASTVLRAEDAPIRVAVIGTGGRGSDLLRALTTIDERSSCRRLRRLSAASGTRREICRAAGENVQ